MLYGCLLPKKDVRDYELCSSINPTIVYPEEFILQNLPQVKYQGMVNSCCAHATSSILEYHDKNNHNLSTNFFYGIQKKLFNQTGYGMYLVQACKIAQKYGDFLEADCKGNNEIPVCYSIAEKALENKDASDEAYKYRISNYYLCRTDNDIKLALMNYGPVLCGIDWYDKFSLDRDYVIHFDKNSNHGGHAVVCVGWDNKKGWLIQNSWGRNWGDDGLFWLPFNCGFFEARAIVDYPNENDTVLTKPNNKLPRWIAKLVNWFLNLLK